jgi:NAD(P)-dependent dehydrogenase (short-subunit alcohol dehydrogenase family)
VTGANKGIGLEIVARLARTQPSDTILLGTRSVQNGKEALEQLDRRGVPVGKVKVFEIDVASNTSVNAAAANVKKDYAGELSTVYNNAGVASYKDDFEAAKTIMDVNYYGVKRMVKAFHPLISPGGHNVVVSSGMGSSATYLAPSALQTVLRKHQEEKTIDELVERYLRSLDPQNSDAATLRQEFPNAAESYGPYALSKAFLNTYIQSTAPGELERYGVTLVAACPGYCSTELNANSGPRKASTGAWSIVMAAQTSKDQAGEFFRDGQPANYYEAPQSFEAMIEDAKQLEAKLQKDGQMLD